MFQNSLTSCVKHVPALTATFDIQPDFLQRVQFIPGSPSFIRFGFTLFYSKGIRTHATFALDTALLLCYLTKFAEHFHRFDFTRDAVVYSLSDK